MFAEYVLFLAKLATFCLAILFVFAGIIAISSKGKNKSEHGLEVKKMNEKYESMEKILLTKTLTKQNLKRHLKVQKSEKPKKNKQTAPCRRIFVLDFHGDIRATAIKNLREEVTAILMVATPQDEIVLNLESGGGMVHAYGLAASQLQRIRTSQIPLTIIIDKIAASGGYMMAAVGHKILAAPFAVIGSIGVIAQLPNFYHLLKKNDIEFEQIMAGEFKRTLTLFGHNTEQGREKLQQEVDETHQLFKSFITANRPSLNIDQVSTGEHSFGTKALELQLIDHISTSDDYLLAASKTADIYKVCYIPKKTLLNKLSHMTQKGFAALVNVFWQGNKQTTLM